MTKTRDVPAAAAAAAAAAPAAPAAAAAADDDADAVHVPPDVAAEFGGYPPVNFLVSQKLTKFVDN